MRELLLLLVALAGQPPLYPEEPEFPTYPEVKRQHELACAFLRWLEIQCEARVLPDMERWDAYRSRQTYIVQVWAKLQQIIVPPFGPQTLLDDLRALVGDDDYDLRLWPEPAPAWFNPDRMLPPPMMPRAAD